MLILNITRTSQFVCKQPSFGKKSTNKVRNVPNIFVPFYSDLFFWSKTISSVTWGVRVMFMVKHNTYPPIKTLDCITSIVKKQSNMVIRVCIWVNSITQEFYSWNIFWVLIRIFIWVNSINQNFYHEIFLIRMQVGGF